MSKVKIEMNILNVTASMNRTNAGQVAVPGEQVGAQDMGGDLPIPRAVDMFDMAGTDSDSDISLGGLEDDFLARRRAAMRARDPDAHARNVARARERIERENPSIADPGDRGAEESKGDSGT